MGGGVPACGEGVDKRSAIEDLVSQIAGYWVNTVNDIEVPIGLYY